VRVGVLGGCGFVGSHVVDVLVELGHEVDVYDDRSSCWLAADGKSPRFLGIDPRDELVAESGVIDCGCEVLVDARLRHPLGRELVLYRESLDRLRSGLDLVVDGALARTLRRFVVVSSLEVFADRPTMLGRHLRAYREALAYLHRPPHLDVEFVHLPELYGPRQLPEAGDVAAAICGSVTSDAPAFGNLGYVKDAARLVAGRAVAGTHRRSTDFVASAPLANGELLYKVLKAEGAEEAAARAVETEWREESYEGHVDVAFVGTALAEGIAETLEFYRWVAAEEEAGR
jgi:nucleoside-diphosphate-sugar epimerase